MVQSTSAAASATAAAQAAAAAAGVAAGDGPQLGAAPTAAATAKAGRSLLLESVKEEEARANRALAEANLADRRVVGLYDARYHSTAWYVDGVQMGGRVVVGAAGLPLLLLRMRALLCVTLACSFPLLCLSTLRHSAMPTLCCAHPFPCTPLPCAPTLPQGRHAARLPRASQAHLLSAARRVGRQRGQRCV